MATTSYTISAEGRVNMCALISIILLLTSIVSGNEMIVIASGLFAIGAEIAGCKEKGEKEYDK